MAYLDITNNNGTRYLRVVKNVRVEKASGGRVSRKRTIKNIGPLSRFDDHKPDFEKRLRESFKAGTPIIKELEAYTNKTRNLQQYNFRIVEHSPTCIGHPKSFANTFIEGIMRDLKLDYKISSLKSNSKVQYDVASFFFLLVCGRILNPASKIATISQNKHYLFPFLKDDAYEYNIYDTLSFVQQNKKAILNQINHKLVKDFHRNPKTIFYDVTNFFFEIEEPDEDVLAEGGNALAGEGSGLLDSSNSSNNNNCNVLERGIRKRGVSKENRKQPIVQMGMFMDDMGIPISCEMFPGNTLDHLTVKDALSNTIHNMDFGRFIFIGDRGMCSFTNLYHILSQGNGYIVSKSITKTPKVERDWIYDDAGYTKVGENFKYKSRIIKHTFKESGDATGADATNMPRENTTNITKTSTTRTIEEKVVVYWDKYFYERQVAENRKFLDFLDKLKKNPHRFRITRLEANALKPYLKKAYTNIETGEEIDSSKLRAMLDIEKVDHITDTYGYYQIVSSELEMSEKEIIDAYHGLTQIEDQFRVMKGVLNTRPMFVRTPEHIDAHLTLCTIALIVMRLIQLKLLKKHPELGAGGKDWSFGMSAERIQNALNKWTVEQIADEYYRFNDIDDDDLKMILDAFGIEIPTKLFTRQELRGMKQKIANSWRTKARQE